MRGVPNQEEWRKLGGSVPRSGKIQMSKQNIICRELCSEGPCVIDFPLRGEGLLRKFPGIFKWHCGGCVLSLTLSQLNETLHANSHYKC